MPKKSSSVTFNGKDPNKLFDLLKIIGRGTYGEVWKASFKKSGEHVAIKIMEDISEAVEEVEETRAMTHLCHGHINLPKFLGVFLNKTPISSLRPQIWIVMELCAAGTVSELVRKRLSNVQCIARHVRDLFSSISASVSVNDEEPNESWLVAHCPCQRHRRRRHRRRYRLTAATSTARRELANVYPATVFSKVSDIDLSEDVDCRVTGRIHENIISYILGSTASALAHLHNVGVIHRDVKGSNILLTEQGLVKLVDFGVSCRLKDAMSSRNTIIGTPYWMAPEVVSCEPNDPTDGYNTRADVWSLGITALELWDGEPPLAGVSPMQALNRIPTDPSPLRAYPIKEKSFSNATALKHLVPRWTRRARSQYEEFLSCSDGLSREFHRFLSKCLVKDQSKRSCTNEIMKEPFFNKFQKNRDQLRLKLLQTLEHNYGCSTETAISNVMSTKSVDAPSLSDSVQVSAFNGTPHTPTLKLQLVSKPLVYSDLAGTKETTSLVCMTRNSSPEILPKFEETRKPTSQLPSLLSEQKSTKTSLIKSNSFCLASSPTICEKDSNIKAILPPKRRSSLEQNITESNGLTFIIAKLNIASSKYNPSVISNEKDFIMAPNKPLPEVPDNNFYSQWILDSTNKVEDLKSKQKRSVRDELPPPPLSPLADDTRSGEVHLSSISPPPPLVHGQEVNREYDNFRSLTDSSIHDLVPSKPQNKPAQSTEKIHISKPNCSLQKFPFLTSCSISSVISLDNNFTDSFKMHDLAKCTRLTHQNILDKLECRFKQGLYYTKISDILLALNPQGNDCASLYSSEESKRYVKQVWAEHGLLSAKLKPNFAALEIQSDFKDLPPHIFGLATNIYVDAVLTGTNQVVVISGESGSGKTTSADLIVRQIAHIVSQQKSENISKFNDREQISGLAKNLDQCLLRLQAPMEAVGNAQTRLNSNSSRCAKVTELILNMEKGKSPINRIDSVRLIGARISHYLLERSRVANVNFGESNFHIFGQLTIGAESVVGENFGLRKDKSYYYLSSTNCNVFQEAEYNQHVSVNKFREVHESLLDLGFSNEEIASFYRILAAIIHLGNLIFVPISWKSVKLDEKNKNYGQIASGQTVDFIDQEYSIPSDSEDTSVSVAESTLDQYSMKEPDHEAGTSDGLWDSLEQECKPGEKSQFRIPDFVYGLKGPSDNPYLPKWDLRSDPSTTKINQFQKLHKLEQVANEKPGKLKQIIKQINIQQGVEGSMNQKVKSKICYSAWRKDDRPLRESRLVPKSKLHGSAFDQAVSGEQSKNHQNNIEESSNRFVVEESCRVLQSMTLGIISRLLGLCPVELANRLTGSELLMPIKSNNSNSERISNQVVTDANTTVSSTTSFRLNAQNSSNGSSRFQLPPRPQLSVTSQGVRNPPQSLANPQSPMVSSAPIDDSSATTAAGGPSDESSILLDANTSYSACSLAPPQIHYNKSQFSKDRQKRYGPAGCPGCGHCVRSVRSGNFEQNTFNYSQKRSGSDEERIRRRWTISEAKASRAAFARSLYGRLVAWLIGKMNLRLMKDSHRDGKEYNELSEQGISVSGLNDHETVLGRPDNTDVLKLFLGRPIGLLALIEEETSLSGSTDVNLLDKMNAHLPSCYSSYKQSKSNVSNNFAISHYAGNVIYDITGFLEKNRDQMSNHLVDLLRQSTLPLVSKLFKPDNIDYSGQWTAQTESKIVGVKVPPTSVAQNNFYNSHFQRSNSFYFGKKFHNNSNIETGSQAVSSFNNLESLVNKLGYSGVIKSPISSESILITPVTSLSKEGSLKCCPSCCGRVNADAGDGLIRAASACLLTASMKDFFNNNSKSCSTNCSKKCGGCVCSAKNTAVNNHSANSISISVLSSCNSSKKNSVTSNFRHSLAALLSRVVNGNPNFVRCIRPNMPNLKDDSLIKFQQAGAGQDCFSCHLNHSAHLSGINHADNLRRARSASRSRRFQVDPPPVPPRPKGCIIKSQFNLSSEHSTLMCRCSCSTEVVNDTKKIFERDVVLRQLHDTGVLETIVIRQLGFPISYSCMMLPPVHLFKDLDEYFTLLNRVSKLDWTTLDLDTFEDSNFSTCVNKPANRRLDNNSEHQRILKLISLSHNLMKIHKALVKQDKTDSHSGTSVEQIHLNMADRTKLNDFVKDIQSWIRELMKSARIPGDGNNHRDSVWVFGRDKILMKSSALKLLEIRLMELSEAVKIMQSYRKWKIVYKKFVHLTQMLKSKEQGSIRRCRRVSSLSNSDNRIRRNIGNPSTDQEHGMGCNLALNSIFTNGISTSYLHRHYGLDSTREPDFVPTTESFPNSMIGNNLVVAYMSKSNIEKSESESRIQLPHNYIPSTRPTNYHFQGQSELVDHSISRPEGNQNRPLQLCTTQTGVASCMLEKEPEDKGPSIPIPSRLDVFNKSKLAPLHTVNHISNSLKSVPLKMVDHQLDSETVIKKYWDSSSSYIDSEIPEGSADKVPSRPVISEISYRFKNSTISSRSDEGQEPPVSPLNNEVKETTSGDENFETVQSRPVSWHIGRFERAAANGLKNNKLNYDSSNKSSSVLNKPPSKGFVFKSDRGDTESEKAVDSLAVAKQLKENHETVPVTYSSVLKLSVQNNNFSNTQKDVREELETILNRNDSYLSPNFNKKYFKQLGSEPEKPYLVNDSLSTWNEQENESSLEKNVNFYDDNSCKEGYKARYVEGFSECKSENTPRQRVFDEDLKELSHTHFSVKSPDSRSRICQQDQQIQFPQNIKVPMESPMTPYRINWERTEAGLRPVCKSEIYSSFDGELVEKGPKPLTLSDFSSTPPNREYSKPIYYQLADENGIKNDHDSKLNLCYQYEKAKVPNISRQIGSSMNSTQEFVGMDDSGFQSLQPTGSNWDSARDVRNLKHCGPTIAASHIDQSDLLDSLSPPSYKLHAAVICSTKLENPKAPPKLPLPEETQGKKINRIERIEMERANAWSPNLKKPAKQPLKSYDAKAFPERKSLETSNQIIAERERSSEIDISANRTSSSSLRGKKMNSKSHLNVTQNRDSTEQQKAINDQYLSKMAGLKTGFISHAQSRNSEEFGFHNSSAASIPQKAPENAVIINSGHIDTKGISTNVYHPSSSKQAFNSQPYMQMHNSQNWFDFMQQPLQQQQMYMPSMDQPKQNCFFHPLQSQRNQQNNKNFSNIMPSYVAPTKNERFYEGPSVSRNSHFVPIGMQQINRFN